MTYSEFLNFFRDALKAFSRLPLNFSSNSPIHALAETTASIAAKNDAATANMEQRLSLLSATGEDLDNLLSNFGITRKDASAANGSVRIWATSLPTSAVFIPSGTTLTDIDGNHFVTIESSVIPSNILHYPTAIRDIMNPRYYAVALASNVITYSDTDMSNEEIRDQLQEDIDIRTESIVTGVAYNVDANRITSIRTSNLFVTNLNPFSGGADVENDESFRSRGLSTIRGANSKFTSESLRAFLLSKSGVLDAKIIDDLTCLSVEPPPTGHIYAIVNTRLLPFNDPTAYAFEPVSYPPDNIYQDLRNAIEDEGYRPAGIGITVRESDVANVGFKSAGGNYLSILVSQDTVTSVKRAELQARIYNYFLNTKLGENIYQADIIKLLKEDPEVISIDAFTFLRITGKTNAGLDISEEVEFLENACNQVCRVKGSEYVSLQITTV